MGAFDGLGVKDISSMSAGTLTVPGFGPVAPPGLFVSRPVEATLREMAQTHNAGKPAHRADVRALRVVYRRGSRNAASGGRRKAGMDRVRQHLAVLAGGSPPSGYRDGDVLPARHPHATGSKALALMVAEGGTTEPAVQLAEVKAAKTPAKAATWDADVPTKLAQGQLLGGVDKAGDIAYVIASALLAARAAGATRYVLAHKQGGTISRTRPAAGDVDGWYEVGRDGSVVAHLPGGDETWTADQVKQVVDTFIVKRPGASETKAAGTPKHAVIGHPTPVSRKPTSLDDDTLHKAHAFAKAEAGDEKASNASRLASARQAADLTSERSDRGTDDPDTPVELSTGWQAALSEPLYADQSAAEGDATLDGDD